MYPLSVHIGVSAFSVFKCVVFLGITVCGYLQVQCSLLDLLQLSIRIADIDGLF